MASVKVIIREDKKSPKTGKAPLYIRLIKERKIKLVSLGISIELKYWMADKEKVRKTCPNYTYINAYIVSEKSKAEKIVLEAELGNKSIDAMVLKENIQGKNPMNFFEFVEKHPLSKKKILLPSTRQNINSFLNSLEKYNNGKKLLFNQIDVKFLEQYESWLLERKLKQSYIADLLRKIKTYFILAIKKDVISSDINPFYKFDIVTEKPIRNYLTEVQLKRIKEFQFSKNRSERAEIIKDMFVFACYGGGLRFSDVLELKWKNYDNEEKRLTKTTRKTRKNVVFKLPNTAIEVLMKYKIEKLKNTDYIFPILNSNIDYENDIEALHHKKRQINGSANKYMKAVQKKLNIPFNLTFHISRHTFATIALKRGMPIEYISNIMGHSEIRTTQIYSKIINKEVDKAMELMND
jgi:integrase/recombinase XerD